MYTLTKGQREAIKSLKMKKLENQRKIAALVRSNELLDQDIADTIATKPPKDDFIGQVASLLSVLFKPGKTNKDQFLTAAEVHDFLRTVLPKDADRLTTRQIGQGLTRLTKASSTTARSPLGLKRGYWLKKVKE